jgi:hypothetical protein
VTGIRNRQPDPAKNVQFKTVSMNFRTKGWPPKLLNICGAVGLLGCLGVLIADVVGILLVEKHNPIRETISKLAIGKYAWIQDLGLDLLAAAIMAIAIGLYILKLEHIRWKLGTALLALLSIDVIFIAEHNQYAGREGVGTAIHLQLVYALGLLFALSTLLLAFGLRKISRDWYRFTLGTSIVWTVLGPVFFGVPTRWDGAYERFVALIMVAWIASMAWLLLQQASQRLSPTP